MGYPVTYSLCAWLCRINTVSWGHGGSPEKQCQCSSKPWLHDKSVFSCSRLTGASSQMLFVPLTDNFFFQGLWVCATFMRSRRTTLVCTKKAEANKYLQWVDSDQQISELMTHLSHASLIVLSSACCIYASEAHWFEFILLLPAIIMLDHGAFAVCILKTLFWQKRHVRGIFLAWF